jgi:hypothetical protein
MTEQQATTSLATVKAQQGAMSLPADQAVDMFTERGFALAGKIAKTYASSNAVPAQFQAYNLKKVGREEHWVENPNALGNCLVAIEVARAVGMSIVAVMQNADMIEGKLRWSGKFVIAAVNASGRFTPLRFQMVNRGRITATFKEKTGWDDNARRPIFTERSVEVDDIECIAWALPKGTPEPQLTLDQLRQFPNRMLDLYKSIGMPVVESAPVTMKLAVEEGWYGKAGSKWQTEMRHLMFQYRAGSYFGNIHAPDIVMGMGPTSEEVRDIQTFDLGPDGSLTPTNIADLRQGGAPIPTVDVVETPATQQRAAAPAAQQQQATPTFDVQAFIAKVRACKDMETLEVLSDEAQALENGPAREAAMQALLDRDAELQQASAAAHGKTASTGAEDQGGDPRDQQQEPRQAAAPAARRGRGNPVNAE